MATFNQPLPIVQCVRPVFCKYDVEGFKPAFQIKSVLIEVTHHKLYENIFIFRAFQHISCIHYAPRMFMILYWTCSVVLIIIGNVLIVLQVNILDSLLDYCIGIHPSFVEALLLARHENCQFFYMTIFSGQKFYTLKVCQLRLFLLTIKQRKCINIK